MEQNNVPYTPTAPNVSVEQTAEQTTKRRERVSTKTKTDKQSVTLKLNSNTQKLLQQQANHYGVTQSTLITILVKRNSQGADEKDVQKIVDTLNEFL